VSVSRQKLVKETVRLVDRHGEHSKAAVHHFDHAAARQPADLAR
jgi:hypothetical protein